MNKTHIDKSTQLLHKTTLSLEILETKWTSTSPNDTLLLEMEIDMERMNNNWRELERKVLERERVGWRILVSGL